MVLAAHQLVPRRGDLLKPNPPSSSEGRLSAMRLTQPPPSPPNELRGLVDSDDRPPCKFDARTPYEEALVQRTLSGTLSEGTLWMRQTGLDPFVAPSCWTHMIHGEFWAIVNLEDRARALMVNGVRGYECSGCRDLLLSTSGSFWGVFAQGRLEAPLIPRARPTRLPRPAKPVYVPGVSPSLLASGMFEEPPRPCAPSAPREVPETEGGGHVLDDLYGGDDREPRHDNPLARPHRQSGLTGRRDIEALRSLPGEEGEIARAIWGTCDDDLLHDPLEPGPEGGLGKKLPRRRKGRKPTGRRS